ncbi:MAG: hypothetical protein ACFFG0_37380 [Candidatus Thorarchaeota archaeon]
MSVIQDVIIDNDKVNEFSQKIITGYSQIEKTQKEIITTEPKVSRYDSLINEAINFFFKILDWIKDRIIQLYHNFKEILPTLFDSVIEGILRYTNKTKKPILLTFPQIYNIFEIFGLEEIYPETFDKITTCLQWKIISLDWIDLEFLQNYKETLLSNVSNDILNAIENLISMIFMYEREEINNKKFQEELSIFLSE